VIFSTKDREPLITASLHDDLLAYLGGIVRELGGALRAANAQARPRSPALLVAAHRRDGRRSAGGENQFLALGAPQSAYPGFDWQTGYGAFSVSQSLAPAVVRYIRDQEKHHRRVTFQEEFIAFLKKNGIAYDERYIWS
jgi:putative transposase